MISLALKSVKPLLCSNKMKYTVSVSLWREYWPEIVQELCNSFFDFCDPSLNAILIGSADAHCVFLLGHMGKIDCEFSPKQ